MIMNLCRAIGYSYYVLMKIGKVRNNVLVDKIFSIPFGSFRCNAEFSC